MANLTNDKRVGRPPNKAVDEIVIPQEMADILDAESAKNALRDKMGIDSDIEATVHVYMNDPETKLDYKIWQGDADSYSLETLAKVFGSGVYRVKVYARNTEGYKPLMFNFLQPWKLSPEQEMKVAAAKEAAKSPPAALAQNSTDMRDMMREMMNGFQATLSTALQRPQVDPFSQMEKLAGMMKALQPAPAATVAPGPDLPALLGMLKTLKDITGSGVPEGASTSEALLLKAADALMPALAEGMKKQQTMQPAQNAEVLPINAALDDEGQQMELMQRMKILAFQMQLKAANKAAARGVNPGEYAETIYDAFDEDDIEGFALNANWFELICQAESGCSAHNAWYNDVRNKIINMALEDGILERGADGGLTVAADSGTSEETGEIVDGIVGSNTQTAAK